MAPQPWVFARRTSGQGRDGLAAILALSEAEDVIPFAGGFPDPATFPGEVLADLMRHLVVLGDSSAFQYGPVVGLPGPRAFIRERLAASEGRLADEDEFMITSGAIEALDLLGKALLERGDPVLLEAPTYLGAIMAFRGFEAAVGTVPTDESGLCVEVLEAWLRRKPRPKLLYTIPDHQNPGGMTLSMDRRIVLAEFAERHGLLVIEDVAYRELGFTTDRLPSLWSLAPGNVVQCGTFSKTFFPGVRMGWAVGPSPVIAQMRRAKQNTDQCAGSLGQRLLEEFGRRGHLDATNLAARALYGRRCALLMNALDEQMPDGVTWTRPNGGFFTWVRLPAGVDSEELAREALGVGVAFVPGSPFYPDGRGRDRFRLSFSCVGDSDIAEGVRRLATVIRQRQELVAGASGIA
ncbi:MAG TPA: PLP-dependent aminotransferase family protein [Pseudonocardiaceae bacterium]|nr:PLP-dependent aminotransferase family protein [Pseudonocardiaceae bacterium]